jgi:hypothetical protein
LRHGCKAEENLVSESKMDMAELDSVRMRKKKIQSAISELLKDKSNLNISAR